MPICCDISKPQKFNMDYYFLIILLADAHSKHILIISVMYSQNFRKLQKRFSEFEWDEIITQKRKSNRALIKKVEFQQHEHFEASEFHIMGWGCYQWNNANAFKGSIKVKLNPSETHVCCVCRDMAKLCSYILYKNISLRNVIKEKHHSRKGVQTW